MCNQLSATRTDFYVQGIQNDGRNILRDLQLCREVAINVRSIGVFLKKDLPMKCLYENIIERYFQIHPRRKQRFLELTLKATTDFTDNFS